MRDLYREQLSGLNQELIKMGAACEEIIALSSRALTDYSASLAEKVSSVGALIDESERTIETTCLKLLLRQQPVARDLRQISAAMKMITDMERIGDQAEDIVDLIPKMKRGGEENYPRIREMAKAAQYMVTEAVNAYLKGAKLVSYGCEPVIAYMAAVEGEITAIRMILTGRLAGIAPQVIRERLRDMYA